MPIQSPDLKAFEQALLDDDIEVQVRNIVKQALTDYKWIMRFGTEGQRMQLLKSALPNLLRALANKDEQQKRKEQQAAYERLREAFRGNVNERRPEI